MKRVVTLLLVVAMILSLYACDENKKTNDSETNFVKTGLKCVSDGINSEQLGFNYSYDMDFDENPEIIKINVLEDDGSGEGEFVEVSIGEYHKIFDVESGSLGDVYICDIDEKDNKKNIVIITDEIHGSTNMRILSYAPELPAYRYCYYNGEENDYLPMWGSYFNVNDDNSITLSVSTFVEGGAWEVRATYVLDKNGLFVESKPEKYEIQHDFDMEDYEIWHDSIKDMYGYEDISEKDREMLKKGYMKAYSDLLAENMEIKAGEYFKAPYDNGKDKVYIEKENGESTWVLFDRMGFGYMNPYFFQAWGF